MSRRTTGIITAVVLILIGAGAGYGIANVLSTQAPEEGLSEAQVGAVANKLISARNDVLLSPDANGDGEPDEQTASPKPSAELLEGRASGGIMLSQGAIAAEQQTYQLLRKRKQHLAAHGTTYASADLDVSVESLTVNKADAIAFIDETTTFTGERAGKPAEITQDVVRVMSLYRNEGTWTMRSIRTVSGKDAPENGL